MSRCQRYQELIEDLLADQITTEDRADLNEHCAECPECAGLLELHQNLVAAGDEIPLPERSALRDMREAVLAATSAPRQTESRPAYRSPQRASFWTDLSRLWRAHPVPAMMATAAVLVGVVLLDRWNPPGQSGEDAWLQQVVTSPAAEQTNLAGYWDTPYSFANVLVRPQDQGQLALSFDVCRHVDVQVSKNSPLAREVLLHAILEPSFKGSRLRAMEVTPQIRDSRLKNALIVTMLNDPDATVRLNALAVLDRYPYDQQIQDALLTILGQDQDAQLRLSAMENLARQNVGLETIRNAVGDNNPEGTMAILRQAKAVDF